MSAPSTVKVFWVLRAPLTETNILLTTWVSGFCVPVNNRSSRSFVTPGASVMSWTKLRLLMESSRTWLPLITVAAVGVVSSTATGAASTVTTSSIFPASKLTSTVRRWLTSTFTSVWTAFLKFGASTVTV